jgi:hypothetical protein
VLETADKALFFCSMKIPNWIPRNPGCGCLLIGIMLLITFLLYFEGK